MKDTFSLSPSINKLSTLRSPKSEASRAKPGTGNASDARDAIACHCDRRCHLRPVVPRHPFAADISAMTSPINQWAIVTGGSSGFGAALFRRLVRREPRLHCLAVGRRLPALEEVRRQEVVKADDADGDASQPSSRRTHL